MSTVLPAHVTVAVEASVVTLSMDVRKDNWAAELARQIQWQVDNGRLDILLSAAPQRPFEDRIARRART